MTRFDWLADILRQIVEVVFPWPWPWPCLTCPPEFGGWNEILVIPTLMF